MHLIIEDHICGVCDSADFTIVTTNDEGECHSICLKCVRFDTVPITVYGANMLKTKKVKKNG